MADELTILMAYLKKSKASFDAGGDGYVSGEEVEKGLGLSAWDGMGQMNYLKQLGLIEDFPGMGSGAVYRLSPPGRLVMDGIPSLEAQLLQQSGAQAQPHPAWWAQARKELLLTVLKLGLKAAVDAIPQLVARLSGNTPPPPPSAGGMII